jgi:hypothetical protein
VDNPFLSIQAIQKQLHKAGIPTIVIGGIAVGAWGEPRLTRDIDLKVLIGRDEADRLISQLSASYIFLMPEPREVLQKQAMLFIQDRLGTRIDLLLAETPYDALAIERGRDVEVQPGVRVRMCSPEDLIIYKLISTRLRDHEDVKGIVRRQGDTIDDGYILEWLRQFEQALDDSTLVNEFLSLKGKI